MNMFAETLAAALELAMGNPWGIGGSLIIGICQGLTAEIGFAIFAYKRWVFREEAFDDTIIKINSVVFFIGDCLLFQLLSLMKVQFSF